MNQKIKFALILLLVPVIFLAGCSMIKKESSEQPKESQNATKTQDMTKEDETKKTTEEETAIPENCVSWFDGCNNCMVSNGKAAACTKKYCPPEAMEEPKCLKYEDEAKPSSYTDISVSEAKQTGI